MDSARDSGHETLMHRIDLPPVWLLLHALAAWIVARLEPWSLSFGGAWADLAAGLLLGGGAADRRCRHADASAPP